MALFMYRYFTTDPEAPFWKANLPLLFAGLSFGIGAAVKWQSIYAGAGMLVLFCIHLSRRARRCRKKEESFLPYFFGTGFVAVAAFIIIPGIIYLACYIPYALPRAPEGGYDGIMAFIQAVWNEGIGNQEHMYKYHANLTATHPYSARWYQWVIDWKPILYYWNSINEAGTRASLWSMTNPLVTWAGLGALAACVTGLIKLKSHTALFILVFYFANLAPWMFVTRATFPYHYFPSMLFLCIGLAWVFDRMIERDKKSGTRHMVAFTAAALALFVLFYPILSGTQVPEWYPQYLLRWLSNGHWHF
jgi:dolichyl-phosphate-mannose--protein O-mannosyl transferase